MNSKGNALELLTVCPALEDGSNKKELTSEVVAEENVSGKSTDGFVTGVVSVKSDEIQIASLIVDLKAETNKSPADVDLAQMVIVDSGNASNIQAITDVAIDNNENRAQNHGKRKQGDNDFILLSSGSDTDFTTTSNRQKAKQARTDPAEEKKLLIQLIRSYPVLYDPNHSDIQTIGSKKAAYQEIGNKMGLTHKQVGTRWYNYYKTYKLTRNDSLLSFLGPFIDDSKASFSGSHTSKSNNRESSDESFNKSALCPSSRSRKTKKVHLVGQSDESTSETEKESDS